MNGGPLTALTYKGAINWGNVVSGTSESMLIVFVNTGNADGTETLALPVPQHGCTFSTDATNNSVVVPAGGSVTVTVTLTVASNATIGNTARIGPITISGS